MTKQHERFMALFVGSDRGHGQFEITGKKANGKLEGNAATVAGPATPKDYKDHLDGKRGLGLVPITPANTVRWGAIDIDIYNINFDVVEASIKHHQLPLTLTQSKSGGLHAWLFTSEPVPADLMRKQLRQWCELIGYPNVEVFPKQTMIKAGEVGNWINLPHFGDTRQCWHEGETVELATFLDLAESRLWTLDTLAEFSGERPFSDGPPCLQRIAAEGVGEGLRNETLFSFGVYFRKKFEDDWQDKLDDFNHEFVDPPLPSREMHVLQRQIGTKTYFYKCEQDPLRGFCDKGACSQRKYGIGLSGAKARWVAMRRLIKIETDPPRWILYLEGYEDKPLELSTEQLQKQALFKKMCIERLDLNPPTMKMDTWDVMVDSMLANCEKEAAPIDAGVMGQFKYLLAKFLERYHKAEAIEDILRGFPFKGDDGRYVFRSADFIKFLRDHKFNDYNANQVYSALREFNPSYTFKKFKNGSANIWVIDAKEFEGVSSSFDATVKRSPM